MSAGTLVAALSRGGPAGTIIRVIVRAARSSQTSALAKYKEADMSVSMILLIILILILIGALPAWPHSRKWGYRPSGILGVLVVVLIILLLMGRI
jgi:hypothetical protein